MKVQKWLLIESAVCCLLLAVLPFSATGATSSAQSPVITVDTRDNLLTVSGRVRAAQTGAAISGAAVSLAGQNTSTLGDGTFALANVVLAGGNTLTVSKSGFLTHTETASAPAGSKSVTLADILLQPSGAGPAVTGIKSKYDGMFLGGVSLNNDYTASVNWNGHTPWSVEFRANGVLAATIPMSGTEATATLDVGSAFTATLREGANQLSVQAVTAGGVRSTAFTQPVKVIPVPGWLLIRVPGLVARQLSIKVVHDLTDPGYSIELKYPDGDIPASALREIPLVGKFGSKFAVGGGCEYAIRSGDWQVYAGASPYGRWAGRRGARPYDAPRFYLGNREIDFGIYGFGSGTATQTEGIKLDQFGIRFTTDFKGEIVSIYLTDYVPGLQWARVLDWFKKVGADINSIQRVRVYGLVRFNSTLYLLVGPPVQYGGVTLGLGAGLEIAYEPDIKVAKGRIYAGGKVEGKVNWPSGQPIQLEDIKAGLYGGMVFTVLGFEVLNEEFALLKYKWTPSSPVGAAVLAGRYQVVELEGQPWLAVPVASSGLKPMPRPHLEAGLEIFVAQELGADRARAAGVMSLLESFRLISQSPVKGSVAATAQRTKSGGPEFGPLSDGLQDGTNQVDLTLMQNVFPGSSPALAARGTELMLLYVADNGSSNSLQFTDIKWTRWDGTNWSIPATIHTNTQAEFAPQVAYDGNGDAIAVWERVADPNFNETNLTAMAAQLDVVWSRWSRTNGAWSEPVAITALANTNLDFGPLLCGPLSNGDALLVWTRDYDNQLMTTNPAADRIASRRWSPASQSWGSQGNLATGQTYRVSQTLAGVNNRAVYAWTRDLDGDLTNDNDQEAFYCEWTNGVWGAVKRLTTNSVPDKNVRAAVSAAADVFLVWQQGTNLVMSRNFSTNVSLVRLDSQTAGFADYALTFGPAGNLVLVWQEMSTNGADAHYAVYDPVSGTWGRDDLLCQDAPLERSFAPVWDDVGNLTVAYNKVQILYTNKTVELEGGGEITITNVPQPGRVDLVVTKRALVKDLALLAGDFTVDGVNYLPGDPLTLSALVRNVGNVAVSNVVVGFYDGNPDSGGVLLTNVTLPGWLEAASTNTANAVWVVPEPAAPHVLYAVVNRATLASEFNESNNVQSVSIGGTDLIVSLVSQQAETNGALRVIAQVQNWGAPTATNSVLAIRREGQTNAPLATAEVPLLEPGRLAQLALDLPAGTQPEGEALYRLFADETRAVADVDTNNNTSAFAVNLWLDADGDGMPDGWEIANGFNPADSADALLDADGDGLSNLAEYLAGTDPNNPNSYLRMSGIGADGTNGVVVAWGSVANRLYTVQRSASLGAGFTNLVEHVLSTPPENVYFDTSATNATQFFYRVKVE